jgi:hypothetical protein
MSKEYKQSAGPRVRVDDLVDMDLDRRPSKAMEWTDVQPKKRSNKKPPKKQPSPTTRQRIKLLRSLWSRLYGPETSWFKTAEDAKDTDDKKLQFAIDHASYTAMLVQLTVNQELMMQFPRVNRNTRKRLHPEVAADQAARIDHIIRLNRKCAYGPDGLMVIYGIAALRDPKSAKKLAKNAALHEAERIRWQVALGESPEPLNADERQWREVRNKRKADEEQQIKERNEERARRRAKYRGEEFKQSYAAIPVPVVAAIKKQLSLEDRFTALKMADLAEVKALPVAIESRGAAKPIPASHAFDEALYSDKFAMALYKFRQNYPRGNLLKSNSLNMAFKGIVIEMLKLLGDAASVKELEGHREALFPLDAMSDKLTKTILRLQRSGVLSRAAMTSQEDFKPDAGKSKYPDPRDKDFELESPGMCNRMATQLTPLFARLPDHGKDISNLTIAQRIAFSAIEHDKQPYEPSATRLWAIVEMCNTYLEAIKMIRERPERVEIVQLKPHGDLAHMLYAGDSRSVIVEWKGNGDVLAMIGECLAFLRRQAKGLTGIDASKSYLFDAEEHWPLHLADQYFRLKTKHDPRNQLKSLGSGLIADQTRVIWASTKDVKDDPNRSIQKTGPLSYLVQVIDDATERGSEKDPALGAKVMYDVVAVPPAIVQLQHIITALWMRCKCDDLIRAALPNKIPQGASPNLGQPETICTAAEFKAYVVGHFSKNENRFILRNQNRNGVPKIRPVQFDMAREKQSLRAGAPSRSRRLCTPLKAKIDDVFHVMRMARVCPDVKPDPSNKLSGHWDLQINQALKEMCVSLFDVLEYQDKEDNGNVFPSKGLAPIDKIGTAAAWGAWRDAMWADRFEDMLKLNALMAGTDDVVRQRLDLLAWHTSFLSVVSSRAMPFAGIDSDDMFLSLELLEQHARRARHVLQKLNSK